MIIVIGKKDKEILKSIRQNLILYRNRYSCIHGTFYNEYSYFIERLSKVLHIKD